MSQLDVDGSGGHLYHVVLFGDAAHSADDVIAMLEKLFLLSRDTALMRAAELASKGKTVVVTCERPQAIYGRDLIRAYGTMRAEIQRVYARPN